MSLGLRKVLLVGHSMGGPVILEATRLMPDRVVALVPVDFFNDVDRSIGAEEREGFLAPMRADFRSATEAFVQGAALATVKVPVRLINADKWPTDLEGARRHKPDLGLAVMPGVGHFLMMEDPEEFNRLLSRAMSELPASR